MDPEFHPSIKQKCLALRLSRVLKQLHAQAILQRPKVFFPPRWYTTNQRLPSLGNAAFDFLRGGGKAAHEHFKAVAQEAHGDVIEAENTCHLLAAKVSTTIFCCLVTFFWGWGWYGLRQRSGSC